MTFQFRPRFEVYSECDSLELQKMMQIALDSDDAYCEGKVSNGFFVLRPKESEIHYWSPHLTVNILENPSGEGSVLRGHYGPSAAIWTMFVFVYGIISCAIVVAAVIGLANITIDESAAILWAIPFLVVLLTSMYLVSSIGQKKGHNQIEEIHLFFKGACLIY